MDKPLSELLSCDIKQTTILQFAGIDDHFEVKSSLEDLDSEKLRDLGGALGLRYPKLRRMG